MKRAQEDRAYKHDSDKEIGNDATIVALAPHELVSTVNTIKTMDVLRNQVKVRGEIPLEYMEVEAITAEIATFVEKMTQGKNLTQAEEERLTYLTDCLTFNPEYMEKVNRENEQWLQDNSAYLEECMRVMRGFVPADVATLSVSDLAGRGMSTPLARRIVTRKCLWLVRMTEGFIGKIHFADLNGQYSTSARNLDVVELCAVLASLPVKFEADNNGKKEGVRQNLLRDVKSKLSQMKAGTLEKFKVRDRE